MAAVEYVRFYVSEWRSDCITLTIEQEGFLIRLGTFICETGQRLPADDSLASKIMRLHTNAYRKLRDGLAALGKIVQREGCWTVLAAEREHQAAAKARLAAARPPEEVGSPDADEQRQTHADTVGVSGWDTHRDTGGVSGGVSGGVFVENANDFNGPYKEKEQEKEQEEDSSRACARGDDMPSHVKPVQSWAEAMAPRVPAAIRIEGGVVVLSPPTEERWLAEFGGDAAALKLALVQARGYVQPNSRAHSIDVQVERQLARLAMDRRDRDRRYAEAAAAKAKPASSSGEKATPFIDLVRRGFENRGHVVDATKP